MCTGRDHSVGHRGGSHTKIDQEWPIAEVFIYIYIHESDYDDECQNRGNA